MRITQTDGHRLVLTDFPWIAVLIVLGILGAVVFGLIADWATVEAWKRVLGLLIIFFVSWVFCLVAKRSVFDFDARTRRLTWRTMGLLGVKMRVLSFDEIDSVELEHLPFRKYGRKRSSYRIWLMTRQGGPICLTYSHSLWGSESRRLKANEDLLRQVQWFLATTPALPQKSCRT